mmetsp:Transcript_33363/g.85247  ORF Transcript_33363/g.85247 Transcript_33363/m.85247 type:complete len:208 (-) Transcript_33363:803-1426(-)
MNISRSGWPSSASRSTCRCSTVMRHGPFARTRPAKTTGWPMSASCPIMTPGLRTHCGTGSGGASGGCWYSSTCSALTSPSSDRSFAFFRMWMAFTAWGSSMDHRQSDVFCLLRSSSPASLAMVSLRTARFSFSGGTNATKTTSPGSRPFFFLPARPCMIGESISEVDMLASMGSRREAPTVERGCLAAVRHLPFPSQLCPAMAGSAS